MKRICQHALLEWIYFFVLLQWPYSLSSCNAVTKSSDTANSVQCFCTAKDCGGPLCDGAWCLVGFKNDVELVQRCATGQAKALINCARKLNDWEEVCTCNGDYCNTFTYMRETLKKYDDFRIAHPDVPNQFDGLDTSNLVDTNVQRVQQKPMSPKTQLVVLLVVVPLGIGAITVCLVFLNYHCKMC